MIAAAVVDEAAPDGLVEHAPHANPDDYIAFAPAAKQLGDIRIAYAKALGAKEADECAEDEYFLNHAKEYADLHKHVETSKAQLESLETFLSTFQRDLSSVSGHISDLQRRSKLLEGRLQNYRVRLQSNSFLTYLPLSISQSLEALLGPLVTEITLAPESIALFLETNPGRDWLPAIERLEACLTAIRSGPRLETRRDADAVAEKLRMKVAEKLRTFLVGLLEPYRTSVASSLQALQADQLLAYRPFFLFLQRLAPRQAHEVQKAYISTAAWYYETGFRRYVRMLDKIRLRSVSKDFAAFSDTTVSSPLAALTNASLQGSPAIPGLRAEERDLKISAEGLFRSISLVVQDNASSEYAFLSAFFGRTNVSHRRHGVGSVNGSAHASDTSWDVLSSTETEVDDENSSIMTNPETAGISISNERTRRSFVDHIWKQVFEPGLDYARNFTFSLFDPPPAPVSALAMIRLNDAVIKLGSCPTQCFEQHLAGNRLKLWPLFQKGMDAQAESFRRLAGSGSTLSISTARDDATKTALRYYAALFTALVALSEEDDDDMVFASALRLRSELQKLLDTRAGKINDTKRSSAYLGSHYEDLLKLVRTGPTSHPRCQAEIAHWREQARRSA